MKRKGITCAIVVALIAISAAIYIIHKNHTKGYDWDEEPQTLYARRLFAERDFGPHALGLYKILADRGNLEGMYMYGKSLRRRGARDVDDADETDHGEGLSWIKRSADAGYARAQGELGIYYYNFDSKNPEGLRLLTLASEQGDREAEYLLGTAMLDGWSDGSRKIEEGIALIRRAAGQGHALAATRLGSYLLDGAFGPKNPKEAVKWLRLGALEGNMQAMELLANCYLKGVGIEKNPSKAMVWLNKAAKKEMVDYGTERIRAQYGLD